MCACRLKVNEPLGFPKNDKGRRMGDSAALGLTAAALGGLGSPPGVRLSLLRPYLVGSCGAGAGPFPGPIIPPGPMPPGPMP